MSTSQKEMGSRAYYDSSDDSGWECGCECKCDTSDDESTDSCTDSGYDSGDCSNDNRKFDDLDAISTIIDKNYNPKCKCLECNCVKPPAIEIDNAGEIKHTKGVININVDLDVTKYYKDIKISSYFKNDNWLKLGDIVPMGNIDNIVVGWSKDEFLSMPTQVGYHGHHYAIEESHNCLETIKGNVNIKPLLKALADGIDSNF